jgi:hypothetical protein
MGGRDGQDIERTGACVSAVTGGEGDRLYGGHIAFVGVADPIPTPNRADGAWGNERTTEWRASVAGRCRPSAGG